MEDMLTMASSGIKKFSLEEQFFLMQSDVVMKPGISLASTSSFKKRIMRLKSLSV